MVSDNKDEPTVGTGYPIAQLTQAFLTALTDADPEVRERAEGRAGKWRQVLQGMRDGTLRIGSRTPVRDWPVWVTPEVVRGGFATGAPAAGDPPGSLPMFAGCLSEPGLADLLDLLDSGRYRVDVPEEAVQLTVAWLVRAGDTRGAQQLVATVAPFAGRLRFHPRRHPASLPEPGLVWRYTLGEVQAALAARRPSPRVMAQREALQVWAPLGDELLALWLETADDDGRVAAHHPPGWIERAAELLARYRDLAVQHTLCGKHRRPRENVAMLRIALEEVTTAGQLSESSRSKVRHAVRAMTARRGLPGSDRLRETRERQTRGLAVRPHHEVAHELAGRLSGLLTIDGTDGDALDGEAGLTASRLQQVLPPESAVVPAPLRRRVERCRAGTVQELIDHGIVGSAEVLASLAPRIVAGVVATGYPGHAAQALVAATYEAFRRRRSLLLLNLEKQVQFTELPWVTALQAHQASGPTDAGAATAAALGLAEVALQAFPGTPLPNRLVRELDTLVRQAGHPIPMVEELAADIFMGTFSPKFAAAARLAAHVLTGSLYERYYGIDYPAFIRHTDPDRSSSPGQHAGQAFADLCAQRAGQLPRDRGWGGPVAVNGVVIEQAQVITTHNLATLATLGITPAAGWGRLAQGALDEVIRQLVAVPTARRPLRLVKNAAYAWRQAVFFLSMTPDADRPAILEHARTQAQRHDPVTRARLTTLLDGLSTPDDAAPFLGWTVGPHPLLQMQEPTSKR